MQYLTYIFLLPIVAVSLAAGLHAISYIHGEEAKYRFRFWSFFIFTVLSMIAVSTVPTTDFNGKFCFLVAWEAMGLSSAGLVAFERNKKSVKKATYIYLLACHLGACALMLAGVLLKSHTSFLAAFFCAIIGFGLKIGFPPFHVWLPEAHPAAPAPASAIMSGAMIPLGFYGLLTFFWPICAVVPFNTTAGWTLLTLGFFGSLGGILFALPQTNLKKLLAFSSVENMGIITLGIALAILSAFPSPEEEIEISTISTFALAGALIHIVNHAFLKGALFLGAGSVLRQTGTLNMDTLGGLMKRMPKTGTMMTLNALGLSGLPPLNGFLGELLIYVASFYAIKSGSPTLIAAGFIIILTLALSGGLATALYCKVIGATFLGEPRSEAASNAIETPATMYLAQIFLFILSLLMIPGSIIFAHYVTNGEATPILLTASIIGISIFLLTLLLLFFRRFICKRGNIKPKVPTWDCGYDNPTARMAYTGSAFTQPITDAFAPILKPRRHLIPFLGHPSSPTDAALITETDDCALAQFWRPIFRFFARIFQRAHLLQNGSLHLYILIILISVIILLIASFII